MLFGNKAPTFNYLLTCPFRRDLTCPFRHLTVLYRQVTKYATQTLHPDDINEAKTLSSETLGWLAILFSKLGGTLQFRPRLYHRFHTDLTFFWNLSLPASRPTRREPRHGAGRPGTSGEEGRAARCVCKGECGLLYLHASMCPGARCM